jgi:hypothetical protein
MHNLVIVNQVAGDLGKRALFNNGCGSFRAGHTGGLYMRTSVVYSSSVIEIFDTKIGLQMDQNLKGV